MKRSFASAGRSSAGSGEAHEGSGRGEVNAAVARGSGERGSGRLKTE